MYKVFVNDNPLFLIDRQPVETNLPVHFFSTKKMLDTVQKLLIGEGEGCYLIYSDKATIWDLIRPSFKIHIAGGGKVINKKGEVLFIYRNGKWDLPKGKLEKGEAIESCAVREVEEECGITGLSITRKLETTYHIFERHDKMIFKITHWFEMHTDYDGQLQPQLEEGITKVEFKNNSAVEKALKHSYANIKLLF